MKDFLLKLCNREDLSRDEARAAFEQIMSGAATEAQIGGLLVGLASKGTTVDELAGAASVMREKVSRIDTSTLGRSLGGAPLLDTCGTGGDVRGTFNISTAAALIAAGAGATVVKHGNRSASGRTGSADVLETLGVKLDVSHETLLCCLRQARICFAYARQHHPAMSHVAQARTALGIPSIFNVLGPLTNPAGAKHQLIGVFAEELTERIALVLRELGSHRAWVVHAEDGLDEISTMSPTRISELRDGKVNTWTFDPRSLDIPAPRLADLHVKSAAQSAAILQKIARGEQGPSRDIAVLNAAGALVVAEMANDLSDGMRQCAEAIDRGAVANTLDQLIACSNRG